MKKIKVCAVGGGTGSMPVLIGLKGYNNIELSVVVTMMDDGGSNKVVRDEYGILPLSDLRKSIIALSQKNQLLRDLFMYRFSKGEGLKGHTLGNLMMMALTELSGGEEKALELASRLFDIKEPIIPVTYDDVRLTARYENGDIVQGEHLIDETTVYKDSRIIEFFTSPKSKANQKACEALENADFIILGPGDFYTSLLANFIVQGVPEALSSSKAKFIYIANLMSKAGQTRGMSLSDYLNEIHKYCSRKPDVIIFNKSKFNKKALNRYKERGEHVVLNDLKSIDDLKIVTRNVVAGGMVKVDKGDELERSLIRHDAEKLGRVLYKVISSAL